MSSEKMPFLLSGKKYVFIASYSLVSARLERRSAKFMRTLAAGSRDQGHRRDLPDRREEEISLPPDIIDLSLRKAQLFTRDTRTSLQRDIEQGSGVNWNSSEGPSSPLERIWELRRLPRARFTRSCSRRLRCSDAVNDPLGGDQPHGHRSE